MLHSWADISAAEQDLGYAVQVSLEHGIEQTIDYYVQQSSCEKQTSV
ncbi:MAG: hypothetical protein ABGZ17_10490 [Planctomycetaceae bacterium]